MKIEKLKYTLLGLVFSTNLIAQDLPVLQVKPETQLKGLLLDPLGNPIIGAKVAVKGGSKRLAVSNFDGEFLILLHRETDSILSISSVGYQPKDVPVSVQQTSLTIELKDGLELSDIEIVGYEVRTKEERLGSVTAVSAKDVAKQVSTNVLSGIQGKVSGVDIRAQAGAYAGQTPSIVIRGLSSFTPDATKPLYVIDGVTGASLESINQQDIEYMEVLKDAEATSLYGSRGGAGVIIIKTKRGAENKGSHELSYSNSFQILQMNKFHDPAELARTKEQNLFANVSQGIGTWINNQKDPAFSSLYWIDENGKTYKPQDVFQTGLVQQHNLSLAGSQEKYNYYLGGSLLNQTSAIKGEDYEKYNLNFSTTHKLHQAVQLSMGASAYLSELNRKYNPFMYILLSRGNKKETQNIFNNAVNKTLNPFALFEYQKNSYVRKGINANIELKVEPIKNLFSTTILSGYYNEDERHIVEAVNTFDPIYNVLSDGSINKKGNTEYSYQVEEVLNYFKGFVDNRLTLSTLGRFNFNQRQKNYFNYKANQLGDAPNFNDFANAGRPELLNSYVRQRAIMQYNGRVGLDWEKKYAIAVGFAGDISSAMPEGNKHAIFPTTSLSWNMKNESFLKRDKVITALKWKAAWGMSANSEAVLDTYYDQLYTQSAYYMGQIGFFTDATKINPNLKWEVVNSTNTGIEIGFFDRLTLNVEYYYKRTHDAISSVKQGLTIADGYYRKLENIGTIQNQGVELNIRATAIAMSNFTWLVGSASAYNRNKVLKINNPEKEVGAAGAYGGWFIHKEGYEMGMLRIREGNSSSYYRVNPVFTGSINNEFAFYNVDISALLVYAAGGYQFINAYVDEAPKDKKEEYIQSSDFIRLRELTLGYTLPNSLMKKIKVKSLRVFVQGGNLFTWVKGKNIVDPEIATPDRAFETNTSNPFMAGFDDGYPANPITITMGLSLKF